MRRVPYWVLGLLLLALGLAVEAGFLASVTALILNPFVLLILMVVVFSIIIGTCIFKYGFGYVEESKQNDIDL